MPSLVPESSPERSTWGGIDSPVDSGSDDDVLRGGSTLWVQASLSLSFVSGHGDHQVEFAVLAKRWLKHAAVARVTFQDLNRSSFIRPCLSPALTTSAWRVYTRWRSRTMVTVSLLLASSCLAVLPCFAECCLGHRTGRAYLYG